jgi:GH15 family glucan-1,4-alpha-glucosidase
VSFATGTVNNLSQAVTVGLWIKPAIGGTSMSLVSDSRDSSGSYKGIDLEAYSNNKIRWRIWDNSGINHSVESLVSYKVGVWQYVTATFDGSSLRIYINGNLDNTTNWTGVIGTPSTFPLMIGRLPHAAAWHYNGLIDDVKIWNYALTAEQVKMEHNGGAVRFE